MKSHGTLTCWTYTAGCLAVWAWPHVRFHAGVFCQRAPRPCILRAEVLLHNPVYSRYVRDTMLGLACVDAGRDLRGGVCVRRRAELHPCDPALVFWYVCPTTGIYVAGSISQYRSVLKYYENRTSSSGLFSPKIKDSRVLSLVRAGADGVFSLVALDLRVDSLCVC